MRSASAQLSLCIFLYPSTNCVQVLKKTKSKTKNRTCKYILPSEHINMIKVGNYRLAYVTPFDLNGVTVASRLCMPGLQYS